MSFKPANADRSTRGLGLYFKSRKDAAAQAREFERVHPDQEYKAVRTGKAPGYPYELYFRKRKGFRRRTFLGRRKAGRLLA